MKPGKVLHDKWKDNVYIYIEDCKRRIDGVNKFYNMSLSIGTNEVTVKFDRIKNYHNRKNSRRLDGRVNNLIVK